MDPRRHARAKEIFLEVIGLSEEERAPMLADLCGSDAELQKEVRSLVDHHRDDSLIETTGQETLPPRAALLEETVDVPNTGALWKLGSGEPKLHDGYEVGEYRVRAVLGTGAFGTVYSAVQPLIDKHVAIKVLNFHYSADPEVVSRFIAEARAVNKIGHSAIIDIFSFGQLRDGRHYYVMELVEGRTLKERIKEDGKIPLDETLEILSPIARALHAAGEAGIAHRDIKPANILLGEIEGNLRPKLLDFGIAKLSDEHEPGHRTNTGTTLGTPSYMSPEQCSGKSVDHRADIYAFAVVAFQMLTGELPFTGPNEFMIMAGHVNDEPPMAKDIEPTIPTAVSDLLRRMLAKDPDDRPATLADAWAQLEAAAAEPTESAAAMTAPVMDSLTAEALPVVPPASNRRFSLYGAIAVVAAVGIGLAASQMSSPKSEPQPQPAKPAKAPEPAKAAPALAAERTRVVLELRGVPDGARILDADGKVLHEGAGDMAVDRGTEPLEVVVEAEGFDSKTVVVTPDEDQVVAVNLERKKRRRVKRKKPKTKPSSPKPADPGAIDSDPHDLDPWE